MSYKDVLFSADIPWDSMTNNIPVPPRLYKYQGFITEDGSQNVYWRMNMRGQFHTSRGNEFEDTMDCRPSFSQERVLSYIEDILKVCCVSDDERNNVLLRLKSSVNQEYFQCIEKNYRNNIQIGCFTDSSNNNEMWNKYSHNKAGFCIEYTTKNNPLFRLATLPVLYENMPYDLSLTLAEIIVLDLVGQAKKRSTEENSKVFEILYSRILKTAYIPLFMKHTSWSFEKEYRMFLLRHRLTREGMLASQDYMDSNGNIDLSDAVTAIYLGQNFENNQNAPQLRAQIISICKEKNISLYKKELQNGNAINKLLL